MALHITQIAELAIAYGADSEQAATVCAIAVVESRGDPSAVNATKNKDGSKDYGLVQWNSNTMKAQGITVEEALDAGCALWWMQRVTNGFANFDPWKGELDYDGEDLRAMWMAAARTAVKDVQTALSTGRKGATISTTRNGRPVVGTWASGEASAAAADVVVFDPLDPGTWGDAATGTAEAIAGDPFAGLAVIGSFFTELWKLLSKVWSGLTSADTWRRVGLGAAAVVLGALSVSLIFGDMSTTLRGLAGAATPDLTPSDTADQEAAAE